MTISLADTTIYVNNVNNPTDGEKLRADLLTIVNAINLVTDGTQTFVGSKTFSGTVAFTSTVSFSTTATFNGAAVFAGTVSFTSANVAFTGGGANTLQLAQTTALGSVTSAGITVSSAGSPPFIKHNGTRWQFSDDGTTILPLGKYFAQCQLTKSGSNLLLSQYGGSLITINGVDCIIPDAGVSLAPGALSAGTTYYIYVFMSSGTMTLEASTTVPIPATSAQQGTGLQIKTGDPTRVLVGMARPIAGPLWVDTAAQRLVISHFNRRNLYTLGSFSADRTTTSSTYVELNTEIRNEFLTWADETVHASITGRAGNTGNNLTNSSIGFDGTTASDTYFSNVSPASGTSWYGVAGTVNTTLAVGYHYATMLGSCTGGGTSTWTGSATAGLRCTLTTMIRG
jgi:hypothetical protein